MEKVDESKGVYLDERKPRELTMPLRQRKFLKYYLECGNVSAAAKKAGYKDIRHTYTIFQSPLFKAMFMSLLDKKGLSDQKIVDKLMELLDAKKQISANITYGDADEKTTDFIEVPDHATQIKALELLAKLKLLIGDKVIEKSNTNIENMRIVIIRPTGSEKVGNVIDAQIASPLLEGEDKAVGSENTPLP